jgi:hypothetical protein
VPTSRQNPPRDARWHRESHTVEPSRTAHRWHNGAAALLDSPAVRPQRVDGIGKNWSDAPPALGAHRIGGAENEPVRKPRSPVLRDLALFSVAIDTMLQGPELLADPLPIAATATPGVAG